MEIMLSNMSVFTFTTVSYDSCCVRTSLAFENRASVHQTSLIVVF